ncbi:MAG TPA: pirin-like C-terminal cupin domain-containing protein [Opitutaceae bacterium]|nr:pirin-like C-terminal cupin domain-containing protein [Opitutaceae bacterium]
MNPLNSKEILVQKRLSARVIPVAAEKVISHVAPADTEQFLYVAEGSLAAEVEGLTTVVHQDNAFALTAGRETSLRSAQSTPCRVLLVSVPHSVEVSPEVLTVMSSRS